MKSDGQSWRMDGRNVAKCGMERRTLWTQEATERNRQVFRAVRTLQATNQECVRSADQHTHKWVDQSVQVAVHSSAAQADSFAVEIKGKRLAKKKTNAPDWPTEAQQGENKYPQARGRWVGRWVVG